MYVCMCVCAYVRPLPLYPSTPPLPSTSLYLPLLASTRLYLPLTLDPTPMAQATK